MLCTHLKTSELHVLVRHMYADDHSINYHAFNWCYNIIMGNHNERIKTADLISVAIELNLNTVYDTYSVTQSNIPCTDLKIKNNYTVTLLIQ